MCLVGTAKNLSAPEPVSVTLSATEYLAGFGEKCLRQVGRATGRWAETIPTRIPSTIC